MSNLNRVVLMGHLGADPKQEKTESGKAVATFSIATNEFIKSNDGEKIKKTDWHKIVTWGKVAEQCAKLLRKGSFVLVEGKIRNNCASEDSNKVSCYEIFATDVSFISNYRTEE